MVAYIPSDHRQSTKYAAAAREAQIREYQAYGPPPPNYHTSRVAHGKGMVYADHSVSNTITSIVKGGTYTHPCSPTGLKQNPTILEEMTFERYSSPGFFDPFNYKSGQMQWEFHKGGWASALAAALQKKGLTQTPDQLISNYDTLVNGPKYKELSSHLLWNPGDRESAVFKDEPAAALVARWGAPNRPFSLIIICPLVRADGIGYERIFDTHNRPPIFARFSVGDQGVYEPLVLMCLPKHETSTGRESYFKDVDWFSMEPVPNSKFAGLYKSWTKEHTIESQFPRLKDNFAFEVPAVDIFLWTLVMLQRRITLGDQVSNLGSWIWQYGTHIVKCGKPYDGSKHKFRYDAKLPYKGMNLTFPVLTGWIMNPKFLNGNAIGMALQWDVAIEALIAYNLDRTDTKWSDFRAKMKRASQPYW